MVFNMQWHEISRVKDRVLRHLVAAEAWKKFDALNIDFSVDNRNVKLALSTDGF